MKNTVLVLIIMVAIGIVWASQVTDDLDTLNVARVQTQDAFRARAAIQRAKQSIDEAHGDIAEIVAGGNFNTIPTDLKVRMNEARIIINTAYDGLNDPNMLEMLNWAP